MNEMQARLFRLGARSLSKILTLQDRVPHSPTYGCFDRNFWHLRITDFPSGMAQEFVLPLALAYAHPFEGNPFHLNPTIREWIRAGIAYAAQSAHKDGACDDYYPFEKAAGAAAFSQYAMLEALRLTGIDPAPFLPFLKLRGGWLGKHQESGRLSNHEALIANGLFRLADLSGDQGFAEMAERRVARLLSWQSDEGWFFEYQGADPGYLTLTIANMGEIDAQRPDLGLRPAIARAIDFLDAIQPPDGWIGGEWTSRNTNNYFPHGMEICGAWHPEALTVNDRAVAAMDPAPEYDDDHILAHHSWSYLKAAIGWCAARPEDSGALPDAADYPEAGLAIRRAGASTLLVATKKGGSYRYYDGHALKRADTGVSLRVKSGKKIRTLVCHLWTDAPEMVVDGQGLTLSGTMGRAKASQMTPVKNVILRVLMLTIGRLNPDLVRQALQRLLITGKDSTALRFERRFALSEEGLEVQDRIHGPGELVEAGIGPAQTSIYTVMSRVYHPPQLQPWEDLSAKIQPGDGLRLEHSTNLPAAS